MSDANVINLIERRLAIMGERLVTSEEGWRLIRAFRRIPDAKRREQIIALVEVLASEFARLANCRVGREAGAIRNRRQAGTLHLQCRRSYSAARSRVIECRAS